jgi:hypothetical protein
MNGICAGDLAGRQQTRNVQVAVRRCRRADAHAFVGKPDMHRVGVRRRVYGDSCDAEFLARALDAQRDFAPVCNQYLIEHLLSRSGLGTGQPGARGALALLPCQGPCSPLLDDRKNFAELDGLPILEENCRHGA